MVAEVPRDAADAPAGAGGVADRPRRARRRIPQAKCPIRYGEPCTACQPGTFGPEDCQLVQLVREDPELRERMREMNRAHRAAGRRR